MTHLKFRERKNGSGVLGNNRLTAATSDQIAIIMNAAIESIARKEVEDVDE